MIFPLCTSGSRLVARIWKQYPSRSLYLLAMPSKRNRQPQLLLSISQLDTRRIFAGDTLEYRVRSMSYSCADRSRNASYAVSNLSWSEATDEASKTVHSESVEELSDTPDEPLSAPDPLSSPPSMTTSAPVFSAVALRSTGIRLGVSANLFASNRLIWISWRRESQSLTCRSPPGTLWAEAEGVEEVLNSPKPAWLKAVSVQDSGTSTNVDSKGKNQVRLHVGWSPL